MTDETGAGGGQKHLYLVDGSGYIFRAYHGIRAELTRRDGVRVNAVYGFCTMLMKLMQDLKDGDKPSHLAVIFDAARTTFRNDIYEDYKANRSEPPEDLKPQFSIIKHGTEAFGVPAVEMEGFEADDLIATYARQAERDGFKVTIVSSDKDLMQLVTDNIRLFDAMNSRFMGHDQVLEKFGVGPDRVVDVQALAGDSVDNVPGVPGIGVKTAAQLINDYGDLEGLLANAGEIKQTKRRENLIEFADLARISMQLVTLKDDVDAPVGIDSFTRREPDPETLAAFLDEQQFRSLKAKLREVLGDLDEEAAIEEDKAVSFDTKNYIAISDEKTLDAWIAGIRKAGIVAVDTETTSLRIRDAELVGISLCYSRGTAAYIPLAHRTGDDLLSEKVEGQLDKALVIAKLKPVFEDPGILKIGQNLKYDISILSAEGISLSPIDDTMLMSYALDAGLHSHGMDELAGLHLDHHPIAYKDVAGTGKAQVTFDKVPLEKAVPYAAEDADITMRLWHILKPRLATERVATVYETLERPLVAPLAAMERAGVKADDATLKRLSNEFAESIDRLEKEIHDLAGESFNVNSPSQLGKILFDKMGLKGGKKSAKTGAWSTNVDVLEALAADGLDMPKKVLEYRSFAKLKSTYTDNLIRDINRQTGRVHTSYHMASTTTGRLSSNDPNLQNIPIRTEEGRKIRSAFVAEPGKKLIAADYSQIELRLLAHIADIPELKQAFADGTDIHALTASKVFGVPLEGMDPMVRRQAKAVNFGIIYGISGFGLARQLGIPRGDAQQIIKDYFEQFPGIRKYMDDTIASATELGYVTTIFGRKVHVKSLQEKNPQMRGFGERAAINAPIQGSAADIIRRAMIRMDKALADAGLSEVQMLLQVHDELVFEAPEALVDTAIPIITDVMENAAKPAQDISVPLTVDAGVGDHWGEAH